VKTGTKIHQNPLQSEPETEFLLPVALNNAGRPTTSILNLPVTRLKHRLVPKRTRTPPQNERDAGAVAHLRLHRGTRNRNTTEAAIIASRVVEAVVTPNGRHPRVEIHRKGVSPPCHNGD
jgi:hypothetical protein